MQFVRVELSQVRTNREPTPSLRLATFPFGYGHVIQKVKGNLYDAIRIGVYKHQTDWYFY